MYYNSAIWNFLCSAWILKGLNLDVNNFTSCPSRLIVNIKILTVKKLLMLIKISIKKFQSKHPTHWGLSNVRGLCRATSLSAAPQAKGRPAVHTGITLSARSKPGIYSCVCWGVWKEGQVKNYILPTNLRSSCPKALNLYKILLSQLHTCSFPVQAWKGLTFKPGKKSNSQHSYFPVTCGDFTWTA